MIHGARAAVRRAKGKSDRLSQWVMALAARRHPNVVATALANKTARIAWAMLRHGTDYQPDLIALMDRPDQPTSAKVDVEGVQLTIAKQAQRWQTGRTGASKTRECPDARSTKKRLGTGARIAIMAVHRSLDAAARGRIYVSSRT